MKKITIALFMLAVLPFTGKAQEEKKEEESSTEKKVDEKKKKKETQEIIIRQNGDKEIKLKVEIDGDNITINGKPMSEFKDDNVTINKRKMVITDGNDMMTWNFNGDGDWEKWGENFGKNFKQNWNFNYDNDGDGAFLGVTSETADGGAKITGVTKASAAEKAGLKKGDVILKIDEEKITDPEVLSDVIGFKKPKDEVKITYKRDGKQNTVKTTLGKRKSKVYAYGSPRVHSFTFPRGPETPLPPTTNLEGLNDDLVDLQDNIAVMGFPSRKKIGLKIQDTDEGGGVKVINVEDSSAAATAGIQKDDIITEINGKKIDNTDDAREELFPDEDKRSYKIKATRGGKEMNFDVKIPKKLKTANL